MMAKRRRRLAKILPLFSFSLDTPPLLLPGPHHHSGRPITNEMDQPPLHIKGGDDGFSRRGLARDIFLRHGRARKRRQNDDMLIWYRAPL